MTIYAYSRRASGKISGAIAPVAGLIDIPAELQPQAVELVAALNAQAGWIKYQAL